MPKMMVSIEGVVVREVCLSKDGTPLGRRPYNDVMFDNLALSGEHAGVLVSQSEYATEYLNSTNSTYVNSRSITRYTLRHDDAVEIGKSRVKFNQDNHEDEHERVTIIDNGAARLSNEAKDHGHSVAAVEGAVPVTLNGDPLSAHCCPLQFGDLTEIGGVQMQCHRL